MVALIIIIRGGRGIKRAHSPTATLFWPRYGCSDFRGIENLHNIFYLWSHQTLDTFFFEVVEPLHVELAQDQFQAWLEARVDALVVDLVGN